MPQQTSTRVKATRVLTIAVLVLVYALTATWGLAGQHPDAIATALPAWNLVQEGTLELSEFAGEAKWVVETPQGWYSNRSPGLIVITALGYLIAAPVTDDFVFWPATLVAVVTAAGAILVVATTSRRQGVSNFVMVALTVGLGTAMWGIASDQIYPHAPASLFVAAAVLFIANDKNILGGTALAVGILIRPPLAIVAAVVGIGLGISRRSIRPVLEIGAPAVVGMALYMAYNRLIFGSFNVLAPYDATGGGIGPKPGGEWLGNIFEAFLSPDHGVLLWSSWVVVAVVVLPRIWGSLSDWARWLVPAGALYLILHVWLNRVSGGLPYSYRYAIEPLILVAPVLLASLWEVRRDRVFQLAIGLTVTASVGLQFAFSVLAECQGLRCSLFG